MKIFIEGNIATGKSTIMKMLNEKGYVTAPEPVNDWKDALMYYYSCPKKFAFYLQHFIMNSMALRELLMDNKELIIYERSLRSVQLFCTNAKDLKYIDDEQYTILLHILNCYSKNIHDDNTFYIYLKCEFPISEARMIYRARHSELNSDSFLKTGMSQYLQQIQHLHDRTFTNNKNCFIVDASQSIDKVYKDVSKIINKISHNNSKNTVS